MFTNPFLCPGTPQRIPYGRYVRLFLITVTYGPRLREITIFSVNASRRPLNSAAGLGVEKHPNA